MFFYIFGILLFNMYILFDLYYIKKNNAKEFTGYVNHIRLYPKINKFLHNVTMDYFDIDNPPKNSIFLQHDSKYYTYKNKLHIETELKKKLYKVYLLTHLKNFGICFNSISLYFCYQEDNILVNIIVEVSNIPWFEKTCYTLNIHNNVITNPIHEKQMHVSPFNPSINQIYKFNYQQNNEFLFCVHVYEKEQLIISSILKLKEKNFNSFRLFRSHIPVLQIYYQALKLYLKNFTIHDKTK